MPVHFVNPCADPAWDTHVAAYDDATEFHRSAWARVLQETYRHAPHYACAPQPGRAPALVPLMEVRSWLTGRRGVSLPFTDECDGLGTDHSLEVFDQLADLGCSRRWKYLEFRGDGIVPPDATPCSRFVIHRLDLTVGLGAVEKGISASALGATRKARSNQVEARITTALEDLRAYYALHSFTRRRHGLPPQTWRFFQSLHRNLIAEGRGFLVLAEHAGRAIAGAVFFHGPRHAIYKFSASDYQSQALRPTNLVMFTAIRHLVELGCHSLNFGRTPLENDGLRHFKLAWGPEESSLAYFRFDLTRRGWVTKPDRAVGAHNAFFRRMPASLNRAFGALLYPHLD